jgi:hypothetical protein
MQEMASGQPTSSTATPVEFTLAPGEPYRSPGMMIGPPYLIRKSLQLEQDPGLRARLAHGWRVQKEGSPGSPGSGCWPLGSRCHWWEELGRLVPLLEEDVLVISNLPKDPLTIPTSVVQLPPLLSREHKSKVSLQA